MVWRREARHLFYSPNFERVHALVGFLSERGAGSTIRKAFTGRRFSPRGRAAFTERMRSGRERRERRGRPAAHQAAAPRVQGNEESGVCPRVGPASAQELIAIRALLERAGLPTSYLESARPEFAVLRENGRVIAAGALQRFGSSAQSLMDRT